MKKIRMILLVSCALLGTAGCQKTYTVGQPQNAGAAGAKVEQADVKEEEVLFDFVVHAGSDVLKFPMDIKDLTAMGFAADGSLEGALKPQEIDTDLYFSKAGISFCAEIYNSSIDTKSLAECKVGGLIAEAGDQSLGEVITLPGNVTLGSTNSDEVKEEYGVPGNIYSRDGFEIYSYENSALQQVLLYFDKGIFVKVDIHNYTMELPADHGEEIAENLETPAEVEEYQAPEELNEDLKSTMIKIGDVAYNLPAPVQQFLDDGWELSEGDREKVIYGEGTGQLTLAKNDLTLLVPIRNYSSKAARVDGCFVTRIMINKNSREIEPELPMGIRLGISEEELKQMLEEYEYRTDETELSRSYFISSTADGKEPGTEDGVLVTIEKETGKVISISVTGTAFDE